MEDLEFQCDQCETMFTAPLYALDQTTESMIETSVGLEVGVDFAECVANFCSERCRDAGRANVMAGYGVPVPDQRPTFDNGEPCAVCNEPVDAFAQHMVFSESQIDLRASSPEPENYRYLALVCAACEEKVVRGRIHAV
jgi:hypothetical protein